MTVRDRQIVQWVSVSRLATRVQLQQMFFSAGARSRCQRRLTLLYRNRYLDKLPGRLVNEPDVYHVSGRCVRGLRLLRTLSPGDAVGPRLIRPGLVPHTLDVASCRVAIVRACQPSGHQLCLWAGEQHLASRVQPLGLLPENWST